MRNDLKSNVHHYDGQKRQCMCVPFGFSKVIVSNDVASSRVCGMQEVCFLIAMSL